MRIGRTIPPAASPIYIRDIINGIKGLIRGQREIERFRSELRHHFGVKHCFLVSSGKAALTLILKALHNLHPEKDEVLIPAFICYSVPSSIIRAGLKVKLCDVTPDTLDFDYDQLKEVVAQSSRPKAESDSKDTANKSLRIRVHGHSEALDIQRTEIDTQNATNNQQLTTDTGRLLAIIPAHLFGLPVDVGKVFDTVTDSAVTVIEDAAQVLGSTWQDKKLGTSGDVGFFSLGRGKALSTVEGGIIITNRDDIAERIKHQLSNVPEYSLSERLSLVIKAFTLVLFQHPALFWFPKSLPFLKVGHTFYEPGFKIRRLSAFQAGLSKGWLSKLSILRKFRAENSRHWVDLLKMDPDLKKSICNYAAGKNTNSPVTKNSGEPGSFIRFPVKIAVKNTWDTML